MKFSLISEIWQLRSLTVSMLCIRVQVIQSDPFRLENILSRRNKRKRMVLSLFFGKELLQFITVQFVEMIKIFC